VGDLPSPALCSAQIHKHTHAHTHTHMHAHTHMLGFHVYGDFPLT